MTPATGQAETACDTAFGAWDRVGAVTAIKRILTIFGGILSSMGAPEEKTRNRIRSTAGRAREVGAE